MKEYAKNKNEYQQNGKVYLEKMKGCRCLEKTGETYLLRCRIIQRGEWEYLYNNGNDYITKQYGTKPLYLSDDAKAAVVAAICEFETHIAEAHSGAYKQAMANTIHGTFYYKRTGKNAYSFVCERVDAQGQNAISFDSNCTVETMVRILLDSRFSETKESKTSDVLLRCTQNTLSENPLYKAAVKHKDGLLEKQIRLYYGIANDGECSWLAKWFGKRILPALSQEYDKKYAVDCSGIDYSLLRRSGYCIVHRPYFSMMGSTHKAWELNPHKKTGVDAAKDDSEIITFSEFLALFENEAR